MVYVPSTMTSASRAPPPHAAPLVHLALGIDHVPIAAREDQGSALRGGRWEVGGKGQLLIFDLDQPQRVLGDALILSGHKGYFCALVGQFLKEYLPPIQAVHRRALSTVPHDPHAGELLGHAAVDALETGVRIGGAKEVADEHARKLHVVRVDRLAGDAGHAVHAGCGAPDDVQGGLLAPGNDVFLFDDHLALFYTAYELNLGYLDRRHRRLLSPPQRARSG